MTTNTLPAYSFTCSDHDYKQALNYDGTKYINAPITFTIDGKKFITPFGTNDTKTVRIHHETHVYIIAENIMLDYISLTYINTETGIVGDCFFSSNDLHMFGKVFEMPVDEQIALLSNYLPY